MDKRVGKEREGKGREGKQEMKKKKETTEISRPHNVALTIPFCIHGVMDSSTDRM